VISCRKARRAIQLRLDERLSIDEEFQLDLHLEACTACKVHERNAAQLEEALAEMPEPPAERLDVERSVATIRRRIASGAAPRRRTTWYLVTAAAVLLFVVAIAERWIRENDRSVEQPEQVAVNTVPSVEESSEPLDRQRWEEKREEVRAFLLEVGGELPSDADRETTLLFADEFDTRALPLRHTDWPVSRIVEGLLESDDVAAARAAARYLGVRGDSTSRRRLLRTLDRPELADASTRALRDSGEEGLAGLRVALARREVRAVALESIESIGGARAAQLLSETWIEEVAETGASRTSSEDLVATLTRLGEHAIPPLIELGEKDAFSRAELLSLLEGIDDVAIFFDQEMKGIENGEPGDLFVECATRFAPEATLSWLTDHLHDRRREELARRLLPRVRGEETVAVLIELYDDSRLRASELERMVLTALEIDAERFTNQARALIEFGPPESLPPLAELLIAANADRTVDPLVVLSRASILDRELRQAAVLTIGEHGAEEHVPALLELFETLTVGDRTLAAACLISIATLGGDASVELALTGASERSIKNVLSLLHRRKASEGKTPSIYKLARELKPLLADRDRENWRTSS
jgi:hypothetical protein